MFVGFSIEYDKLNECIVEDGTKTVLGEMTISSTTLKFCLDFMSKGDV